MRLCKIILVVFLLSNGNLLTLEMKSFQNVVGNRTLKWQANVDSSKTTIICTKDYFGAYTNNKEHFAYRHYDLSGQLLWSTELFDYNPWDVTVSMSGNRIIFSHIFDKSGEEFPPFVSEIYDADGKHLFTASKDYYLYSSSPTGRYYYSITNGDDMLNLSVLDEKGREIYTGNESYWGAEPLNDSLLVCIDFDQIDIVDVFSQRIARSLSLENIVSNKYRLHQLECSERNGTIVAWGVHEIYVFDSNLNVISSIKDDIFIVFVKFADDSDIMAYIGGDLSKHLSVINFITIKGSPIYKDELTFPDDEVLAGENGKTAISFDNGLFIYRFIAKKGKDKPYSKADLIGRSYMARFDKSGNMLETGTLLKEMIYPMADNKHYLEIDSSFISYWLEGETK